MNTPPTSRFENTTTAATPLLVFSDDWGRHPSSSQHLIRAMPLSTSVTWVNTIGMRPPRLDMVTMRRGAEKLLSWARNGLGQAAAVKSLTTRVSPGQRQPAVIDAKMWPWMARPHDRWLNKRLLVSQLAMAARDAIVVTTIPIVADLVDELPAERWVYYCVDDFSVWPGLDQETMLRMERALVGRVDRIIAASEVLQGRMANLGREADLLTHGVDVDRWRPQSTTAYDWPAEIRHPVLLFWGVVDRRMDSEWLHGLSSREPDASIVLVGPHQGPDPAILALPNVYSLGAVDFHVLPSIAKSADCLIMPYVDAQVTRAMQPLKLKEYMATGKPVVARRLPATESWSDCLDLAATEAEFCQRVKAALTRGLSDQQSANRDRLTSESWEAKARLFSRMIEGCGKKGKAAVVGQ